MSRFGVIFAGMLAGATAWGQQVISAKSGVVHYVEGDVTVAGKPVTPKFGEFPEIPEGAELRTAEGRAEVLLNPGVILRAQENTGFRLLDNNLVNTRIELLAGSILIEAADIPKGNAVTLVFRSASFSLAKRGVYRLDAQPERFRVYQGEAVTEAGGQIVVMKEGREMAVTGVYAVNKFDNKTGDAFTRWSRRRAEYLATANISTAKTLSDSSTTWSRSGWVWNPYYAMFTFLPVRLAWSPYGYRFWSPNEVYRVYQRPVAPPSQGMPSYAGFGNPGYRTVGAASGGYSGTVASAPAASSAPTSTAAAAPTAPVARESAGGGRSR